MKTKKVGQRALKKKVKMASKKKEKSLDKPRPVLWYEKKSNGQRTGRTIAVLKTLETFAIGISRCSKKDPFCRKIGRDIAIGRAEHAFKLFQELQQVEGFNEVEVAVPKKKDSSQELMAFAVRAKALGLLPDHAQVAQRLKLIPPWLFEERRHPVT